MAAFLCLEPGIFQLLNDDTTVWEKEPLQQLVNRNELAAYLHHGFWQPMDTLRDRMRLEEMWRENTAPWKVW